MLAKYLWEFGSLVFVVFGVLHLLYTFFTDKFSSNKNVVDEMKASHMNITKETTIWEAWIGFNGSHSVGVIFIGVLNFYLALEYFSIFEANHFFFMFNIATVFAYVLLAKKYWFKIPFIGISLTLISYLLSYFLTYI